MAFPIAHIGGVEIRIHWTWILALAILTAGLGSQPEPVTNMPAGWTPAINWLASAIVAALVFVSVIVHELAHVAIARRAGVGGNVVTVQLLGGSYVLEARPHNPGQEFRLAAAGPALSLLLAVLFGLLAFVLPGDPLWVFGVALVASWASLFNLFLTVVNLLPTYPMDGGRIVRAILWRTSGEERTATLRAGRVGRFIGVLFVVAAAAVILFFDDWAYGLAFAIAGWLLFAGGGAIDRRTVVEDLVAGLRAADAIAGDVARVPPQLTLDTFADEYLGARRGDVVLVERGGELLGILGATQLRRTARRNWPRTHASEAMAGVATVPALDASASLWEALEVLERSGMDALFVRVDEGPPSVLTRRSAATVVHERAEQRTATARLAALTTGSIRGYGRFRRPGGPQGVPRRPPDAPPAPQGGPVARQVGRPAPQGGSMPRPPLAGEGATGDTVGQQRADAPAPPAVPEAPGDEPAGKPAGPAEPDAGRGRPAGPEWPAGREARDDEADAAPLSVGQQEAHDDVEERPK